MTKEEDLQEFHDYLSAYTDAGRRVFDEPEYYFRESTPEQEARYENYPLHSHIEVPSTIDTNLGRFHYRVDAFNYGHGRSVFGISFGEIIDGKLVAEPDPYRIEQQRAEAIEKLNSLTPEEIAQLREKAKQLKQND